MSAANLYGPPPWHFAGRSITVLARCDPAGIAALTPTPLTPCSDIVRFSVHDLFCDLGRGKAWAQANPAESCFREAVIGIAVEHAGTIGFWDPFLWTDSDAELAVGREVYGWPQRLGRIDLTPPHPITGWQHGDHPTGRVSRLGTQVFDLSVTLTQDGPPQIDQPPFTGFYLERIIPDPTDASSLREIFFAQMQHVTLTNILSGPATLTLHTSELSPLGTPTPLAGQVHTITWTKAQAQRILTERLAPAPQSQASPISLSLNRAGFAGGSKP